MDFKLILLLLGLGHLIVVVLYALWGFLGGLKRELKCTAVLLILLLLGWLIFSDPAMMMGMQLPANLLSLLSSLGVEAKAASVWEVVLQVLQAQVPNGSALFIEGREAYELAYDLVAGALRGVGLIVITLVMLYLSGLIRFVSHIVKLIVTKVKKAKAKNALPAEAEEAPAEEEEEEPEQVVVLGGVEGGDDVVVTTDVNELPAPKPITQRIWGGVVGLIKACVVLCITFVPLSGVVSILDETSEETRDLISDLVSGEQKLVEGEESSNVVDILFDFVDDYNSSPLGLCVESTSYFFGDSFSTLMFDSLFFVSTDSQRIPLRQELVTFIHAVNALEGNIDYKDLDQDKLSNALDELKDSQLLPELMPAVIEFAYETQQVKDALIAANQEALFLQLRYVDWDKDLEKLLDVVKVAYSFDIFAEDFNYLTLDVSAVRTIVELLSSTEFLPKALPVAVKVAIKLDAAQQLIQNQNFNPDVKNIDWAKDLNLLVDVYEDFQKLGITSLEGLNKDVILEIVFEDDAHVQAVKDILSSVVYMDLFTTVLAPAAECIVDAKILEINKGQFKSLVGVLPIKELTAQQWESDLHTLVDLADKFYDLDVFGFEIVNMDLTSPEAVEAFKYAIDEVFGTVGENAKNGLNILRQKDALLKIIDWAFKNFDLVAMDAELAIVSSNISLPKEGAALKQLIDVYADLAKYPEFDINNMKFDIFGLLEKDDIGEIVTRALEALANSDIILNTLVPILEHKVVPLVSQYEDVEDLVSDIINTNASDTPADLINEVSKLVTAVFSAKDLGLLAVPRDGLKAIDFAKTEDMKKIVDALFDTELFKGFEARILKVILKFAKIEVELSDLEGINFELENDILNSFIDEIAPVLKDERFVIFNEDNKIEISDELMAFILSNEGARHLVDGLQVLFGDYEAGTTGSQLVPVLLRPVYDQVLADKVPAQFAELMDIIDINDFTVDELAHDLRAIIFMAEQLVEFEVLNLINKQPGNISFEAGYALENADIFFQTLGEVNIVKRRFAPLFAYGFNLVVEKYNEGQAGKGGKQLIIDTLYAKDFEKIDLASELDLISTAIKAAIRVLNDNAITQVVHLQDFIKNKEYLTEEFLTNENGHAVLDIVEPLTQLDILPVIVKAAERQIYISVANMGLNIDHVLNVKNEEISEDLGTLIGIVRKAVDFGALEFVYAKDISDINYDILASVIYDADGADISDLNILQNSQAKLMSEVISFVMTKVAPKSDFTITPSDLKNTNVVNDFAKLSEIVLVLGEVIEGLDLQSFNDIKDFTKELKAEELLKDENLVNYANVDRVCEILALVSEMTYFEAISPIAFNELVMSLAKKEAAIENLYGTVSGAELAEDLRTLSTLGQALKDANILEFTLGKSVYSLNEEAFAEIIETVLSTNIVNNNNLEIVKIIVGVVNNALAKVEALNGLEIEVRSYLFDAFTAETWANDQAGLAEAVAHLLGFAFDELGLVSINSIKAFINDKEFKYIDFYTSELVEEVVVVLHKLIDLNTVGALLPSILEFGVDAADKAIVGGQELDIDLLYILEAYDKGYLTNEMIADDILTIGIMAIELINNGAVKELNRAIKNKAFNDMPLELAKYADAVQCLGFINLFNLDSAKFTTELVNFVLRLAKLDLEVVEKDFVHLTDEQWLEDSKQLAQLLRDADALLEGLGEAGLVKTINGIQNFIKNDAKEVQNYLTNERIDEVVAVLQSALSFNAGDKLITKVVNHLLPLAQDKLRDKPQFVSVELDFLENTISQATLHDDVATIGAIAKEAIAFGLIEYLETKDIADLELVYIANIVGLFGELNLYNQAREGWYVNAALVASDATKKNFILTYEDLEGINFEEDNEQLQAVIMQLDELLKANKHESLSEVINFAKDLGATYEQWATLENGKAIVDILNGLADVDILMVCGASTIEYVVYLALTKDIDIRFLYDKAYKGADLGADVKIIAGILDEALEFGLIDIVWKYPIEDIDLSHAQNIIKYVDQLHLFGLDKANWTALIVNKLAGLIKLDVEVTAESFAHIDWAKENAAYVALIGTAQEILDTNKFDSTTELNQFIKDAAYLSNQYVTEENFELIAQVLDNIAELDTLEVVLPNLAEFGMTKLGTGVEGDFTTITSKEFNTLAYMIREIVAFGAVEMYNNILWNEKYFYEGEFDLSHVINVVEALEDLEILAVDKAHLAQFIASKLNLGFVTDLEVLATIDYSAENAKVVEIIKAIEALMQNTYLTNLENVYNFIEQEGYFSAQYIDDANVLFIADIIELVSELQLLAPYAGEALDLVFLNVEELHYLVGQYEGGHVVEDLVAVANIIRELVEFDAIDLFYWQTTEEFQFDALRNALEMVLNLNILNVKRSETMALAFNKLFEALKVNAYYTASDFEEIDFAQDDETILAIYDQLVVLAREMNIDNTATLKAYIDEKGYMLAQYTNEITIEYAVEILDLVAGLQQLEVVIDEVLLTVLPRIKGIDLSFLVDAIEDGDLTAEDLIDDVYTLVEIAHDLLDYELYNMIYSNEYKAVDIDKFVEIFVKLDDLYVLSDFRPEWSVLIVNKAFGKFLTISEEDLEHITEDMWADEIYSLAYTIVAAYEYLVYKGYADNGELNRLYNELVKEKKYEDVHYLVDVLVNDANGEKDSDAILKLLQIITIASHSNVSGVVLHGSFTKLVDMLDDKGIDLTELPEMLTIKQLQDDVYLLASAAYNFIMFGGIELVLDKGAIDYNNLHFIYDAIERLLATDIANVDSGYLMGGILKDETSRTTGYFSEELYLDDKAQSIIDIIDNIAYVARIQEFNTLQDFIDFAKAPKSRKIIVNSQINSALLAIANALEIMGQDEFFAESILSGTYGYLASTLDKYPGITDIYKIYIGETLAEDLDSISDAIAAVCELDVYAIITSKAKIPYTRVDVLETVLTEILGLNYFNETGRIEEIVEGASVIANADLSELEDMNLDLVGDAAKLVKVYEELLVIFQSEEWPYIYVEDFKDKSLTLDFILSNKFIDASVAAFNELKSTTIYEETNGAILAVLLPIFKVVLPEYYEALNFENCSLEDLINDFSNVMAMVERVQTSGIIDAIRNTSATIDVTAAVEDVKFLIDTTLNIKLLGNGSLKAVTELLLRDLVYGKSAFGFNFYDGLFDLTNVELESDAEAVKAILDEVLIILLNSNIDSIADAKDHLNVAGAKQIAMDNVNLDAFANIMDIVSEMTFVQANATVLWHDLFIARMENSRFAKYAKYIAYEGATNEQLVEELTIGADIVRTLIDLEIVDIYHGAQINYDQASEVEALLALIGQLNYFEINNEKIYNFVSREIIERGGVMFGIEEFTIASDLAKFGKVYAELVPFLMDDAYPYTTLSQYLDILRTRSISGKRALVELAYDYRSDFLDAYRVARSEGLGKYAIIFALPAFKMVLPEYHAALNLEGYTYEDLKADAQIGIEIAKRAKDSQILDVLKHRGSATIDFTKAVEDVEYIMNKALEMKIIGNDSLEEIAQITLEKYVYGKSIAGVEFYDCQIDFSEVDARADAEVLVAIALEVVAILQNEGITTLGEVKARANMDAVKAIVMDKVNLEHIANIMDLCAELTLVQTNATNVWNNLVMANLETSRLAKYAKYIAYEGATNEQLVEELTIGADIIRVLNDLEIVNFYMGDSFNYDQVEEIEQLLALIGQLNYFEINNEKIYNFVANKVIAYGGVMFGIEEFTIATDLPKFAKVYAELVPFLMDDAFPFTKLSQFLDMLRTRSIPGKRALVELAYDYRSDFLDALRVARSEGLGKYAIIFALPAVKVVLPDYHAALNLDGYTYEDLKADAQIGIEIAKIAKESQILDVLRHRGSATIDFTKAVEDAESIMYKALEMKIISDGSIEEIAQITLEKYVYGKTFAGIYIADCNLDFSTVDAYADAEVLVKVAHEVVAILQNEGITTLGDIKARANMDAVKAIVMDKVNLEHIANIIEITTESTFVQTNVSNLWDALVLPRLQSRGLDKLVTYQGATNEQFVEDILIGAEIVRALNDLEIASIYMGDPINYDQPDEIRDLLVLISQLNYFEVDEQTIFDFIASKVSALYHYNVSPQDLDIPQDLVELADVYEEVLPILLDSEYPFTTLSQYLEILRTRNISGKTALVNVINNNKEAVVSAYEEVLDIDVVKYCVLGAYNKVASLGVASSLVSLFDVSDLTIEEIEEDLYSFVDIADAIAYSGINFGVEDGKIGILSSSVIDYSEINELTKLLFELNCLEGDFDALVDIVASKVGLSLEGTYVYGQEEIDLIEAVFDLIITFENEFAVSNLGDLLNYYKDLENTVDLVMSNNNLQNSIVYFIDVASKSILGQDLIISAYNEFAIPALPSDYQDFINFEDPTYTPDLWAFDFQNMFIIYNKLEALDYENAFVPTISEVEDLYSTLFILNTPHSIKNNPQTWLDKLLFSNLPTFGLFAPEYQEVTNWNDEIYNILAVISQLGNILGQDREITGLGLSDFYEIDNLGQLTSILTTINNTKTMRSLTIAIVDEAVNVNDYSGAMLNVADLISDEFKAQVTLTGYEYDESFWTSKAITDLSLVLLIVNELLTDENGAFVSSALDFTSTEALGDYYLPVLDVDTTVSDDVCLGHLLIALYDSNVFDITVLGGPDGLIADELNEGHFISSTSLIGEIESREDVYAMLDVIVAVNAATDSNLNDYGFTLIYNNISSLEVHLMIESIKDSKVLRGILPFLMHDLVAAGISEVVNSTPLDEAAVEALIVATIGADLANAILAPTEANAQYIYDTPTADLISVITYLTSL